MEKECKNCLLFDKEKKLCKVAILIDGEKFNLPVDPNDNCHMDELQIPVEQIRWFEEKKDDKKTIKIEYPEHLFKE